MPQKPVTQKEIEDYAVTALKRWLKKAMTFAVVRKRVVTPETKAYTVDLSVCTAPKMADINFAFRKIKSATDILSFPTHEFFQRQGMLGDLVLCAPVALKQAAEIGHPWKKEVDVLLVHGILHLLRFDHETGDNDAREMSNWEGKILGASYKKSLIKRVHEMPVEMDGVGKKNVRDGKSASKKSGAAKKLAAGAKTKSGVAKASAGAKSAGAKAAGVKAAGAKSKLVKKAAAQKTLAKKSSSAKKNQAREVR